MAAYEGRFARCDNDPTVLKWMAGSNLCATLTQLFLTLRH